MSYLIKPAGYKALLNLSQTEMGIKKIKDFFQQNLSSELRLRRVTAPLFVLKGMGINDDLNGIERNVRSRFRSRIWTMPKLKSSIRLPNGNALLLLIIKSKKATVSIPT